MRIYGSYIIVLSSITNAQSRQPYVIFVQEDGFTGVVFYINSTHPS